MKRISKKKKTKESILYGGSKLAQRFTTAWLFRFEVTIEQVKKHLEALVEDTLMIEWGRIAVPKYETFIERKVRTKHRGRTH